MKTNIGRGFLVLILVCCGVTIGTGQKHYTNLAYPPLSDIEVPEIQRVTLDNGIQLFILEDHELPLIRVSGRIRTGSIYEPADKIGLASITGTVIRSGGTTSKTGDEIDEELERIAASVETGIGDDAGLASMSVLKQDLKTGLSILADILMNPAFPEDKIQLAKIQHRSTIARRNDSPGSIAGREFSKLIYGAESPRARHSEYATIDRITRQDLIDFHSRYFSPDNTMFALWGDFDTNEMIGAFEEAFRSWGEKEVDLPEVPPVDYEFRQTVNLVEKADVNQSTVYMGHIGGLISDPDYFALALMNRILGSGFTSRLFREVRSRQGLAYSVFGRYSAGYDHRGMFYVGAQTRSDATVRAIRAMKEQVEKITQEEVTDEELEIARESFLNSFVFNFDSKAEIVNRMMTYAYYGYPLDFLQKMKDEIEKVTKAEILGVAKRRLHPDQMQILVVGKPQDFDQPLSEIGPVKQIDITIPAPETAHSETAQ